MAAAVPFPFLPAAQPITERLAWITDVLRSRTGAEQRRALRLAPRRSLTASFVLSGPLRSQFDTLIAAAGAAQFALPVWPDLQLLAAPLAAGSSFVPCDTDHRDFTPGGLALVADQRGAVHELLQIDTVQPAGLQLADTTAGNWPAGAALYPVRRAVLQEPPAAVRRLPGTIEVQTSFETVEPCDWPPAPPAATYLGRAVLERCLHIASDLSQSTERLVARLDNATGIPQITDTTGALARGFDLRSVAWMATTRADAASLRALLCHLRGRQRSLWLPSSADDLHIISAAGSTIQVQPCGYSAHRAAVPDRQHIRVQLADGSALYRHITGASVTGSTETLALDTPLGVPATSVQRISFMVLARQVDDEIELTHTPRGHCQFATTCAGVWRSLRADLELAP